MLKRIAAALFLLVPALLHGGLPTRVPELQDYADKPVSAVLQEEDASLWMSIGQSLCRFNGHVLQTVVPDIMPEALASSGRGLVYTISGDRLTAVDTRSLEAKTIGVDFGFGADCRLLCRKDSLYFSSGPSLYVLSGGAAREVARAPSDITALGLFEDELCAGCADGHIYKVENGSASILDIPLADSAEGGAVRCFCADGEGNLYLGYTFGLVRRGADGQARRIPIIRQGPEPLRALSPDGRGGVWIGTYYDGLFHMSPGSDACRAASGTVKKTKGTVEREDCSTLYFTDGYGIFRSAPGGAPEQIVGTEGIKIQCAYDSGDGFVWCGNFKAGLLRFDLASSSFLEIPFADGPKTTNVITSFKGDLAIGTESGVYLFDPSAESAVSRRIGGVGGNVFALAAEADRLWTGSRGLYLCTDGVQCRRYTSDASSPLYGSECTAICLPADGGLPLVGTSGYGFCRLGEDGGAQWHTRGAAYAAQDIVAALATDEAGRVVAATSGGVSVMERDGSMFWDFTAENCEGMGSARGGCIYRLKDGTFLVGGKESVTALNTGLLRDPGSAVEFELDCVREEDAPEGAPRFTEDFSYKRNDICAEIAVREYDSVPSKVFQCRLSPLERDWRPVKASQRIVYRNLRAGHYTLTVRASRDGLAPYSERSAQFTIHPVWYATIAAKILWAVLVLALLSVMASVLYSRLLLRERLAAEQKRGEERNRNFVDISRRLRTPLALTLGEMESFFQSRRDRFAGRGHLETAYHNAMKLKDIVAEYVEIENEINSSVYQQALSSSVPLAPRPVNAKKMLVADDDPEMRRMISALFADRFTVIEAEDGSQALTLARAHHPDIILSDVQMPVMDGISLCCALRDDTETCHIPIMLVTARASEKDRLEGIRAGADDYVTKPFNGALLAERCYSLLRLRQTLREKYSTAPEISGEGASDDLRERILGAVERNLASPELNVALLCSEVGMARTTLNSRIQECFGMSTRELIEDVRLRHAANMMAEGEKSVLEVSEELCFSSPKYFALRFKKKYGNSPLKYRNLKK